MQVITLDDIFNNILSSTFGDGIVHAIQLCCSKEFEHNKYQQQLKNLWLNKHMEHIQRKSVEEAQYKET